MFNPSDLPTFAPNLNPFDLSVLSSIALVESLISAYVGRSLDITEYTEIKSIGRSCPNFFPSYLPIVNVLSLRVRTGVEISEWQIVPNSDYAIDADGQIILDRYVAVYRGWGRLFPFNEVEIRYLSGYDFTQNTKDILAMKAAFGAILNYVSSNMFQGITELDVKDDVRVKFAASEVGRVPDGLFAAFSKYKVNNY